ncbi:hypothetical protein FGO68_gene4388 [Halteria grandinella]|uniref:Uncharacterized protein n=1 Tax=Halteria grandinella TaxID=5974 RepID=A0A8J8T9Q6_HALGN|nr:hypothetical protein FGO68_gene4388 [Halteria grandinella]
MLRAGVARGTLSALSKLKQDLRDLKDGQEHMKEVNKRERIAHLNSLNHQQEMMEAAVNNEANSEAEASSVSGKRQRESTFLKRIKTLKRDEHKDDDERYMKGPKITSKAHNIQTMESFIIIKTRNLVMIMVNHMLTVSLTGLPDGEKSVKSLNSLQKLIQIEKINPVQKFKAFLEIRVVSFKKKMKTASSLQFLMMKLTKTWQNRTKMEMHLNQQHHKELTRAFQLALRQLNLHLRKYWLLMRKQQYQIVQSSTSIMERSKTM